MSQSPLLSPLERVRRISVVMRMIIAGGMLLDGSGVICLWLSDDILRAILLPELGLSPAQVTITATARIAGWLISLAPASVMFAVLVEARGLFGDYAQGNVFSHNVVRRLRRLAIGVIGLACLQPFVRTALVLALTFGNPPGQRLLALGISSNDYMLVAFGGLLLAIAWVMVEAVRIADENSHFI